MSDWPKKMWMSFAGSVNAYRDQIFDTDYPVLVYPADQAPEPVAWHVCSVNKDGSFSLEHAAEYEAAAHEHINDAINDHAIEGAESWVVRPVYLAPPSESAIRASERERCAKVCEKYGDRWSDDSGPDPSAYLCARAIRELGDD